MLRYQPKISKPTNLPVFDKNKKKFIKHKKIEVNINNCKIMYNNGFAPRVIHPGNLGCETINGRIKQYVNNN